jgi:hypothetical protein
MTADQGPIMRVDRDVHLNVITMVSKITMDNTAGRAVADMVQVSFPFALFQVISVCSFDFADYYYGYDYYHTGYYPGYQQQDHYQKGYLEEMNSYYPGQQPPQQQQR